MCLDRKTCIHRPPEPTFSSRGPIAFVAAFFEGDAHAFDQICAALRVSWQRTPDDPHIASRVCRIANVVIAPGRAHLGDVGPIETTCAPPRVRRLLARRWTLPPPRRASAGQPLQRGRNLAPASAMGSRVSLRRCLRRHMGPTAWLSTASRRLRPAAQSGLSLRLSREPSADGAADGNPVLPSRAPSSAQEAIASCGDASEAASTVFVLMNNALAACRSCAAVASLREVVSGVRNGYLRRGEVLRGVWCAAARRSMRSSANR
jgi:hypothetical protein